MTLVAREPTRMAARTPSQIRHARRMLEEGCYKLFPRHYGNLRDLFNFFSHRIISN